MPKNTGVFSGGTGQNDGARPEQRISNIYKMYRISRDRADAGIDRAQQPCPTTRGSAPTLGPPRLFHQSALMDFAIATIRPK